MTMAIAQNVTMAGLAALDRAIGKAGAGERVCYAGIGARATPPDVQRLMMRLGLILGRAGLMLRSGGAEGADSAFAAGTSNSQTEIFLPWRGFRSLRGIVVPEGSPAHARATAIAQAHHPAWERLSRGAAAMMVRNSFQILGPDCQTPSAVVIAWTEAGAVTGGTGQALRVAATHHIPVLNLGRAGAVEAVEAWLTALPGHRR